MSIGQVRHGFKNCYYALANDSDPISFETPVAMKGAVSFSPSKSSSNSQTIYADNVKWFEQSSDQGGSGEITFVEIEEQFMIDVLGYVVDSKGVLLKVANCESKKFAFMGEYEHGNEPRRFVFYYCTASPISESYETDEGTFKVQKPSLTLSYSVADLGLMQNGKSLMLPSAYIKQSTDPKLFADFFKSVYIPALSAPGGGTTPNAPAQCGVVKLQSGGDKK